MNECKQVEKKIQKVEPTMKRREEVKEKEKMREGKNNENWSLRELDE